MVEKECSIKRKFIPNETHDIIRGIDSNHNEVINKYTILSDLGEGAFSSIKLFLDNNTQKYYATKIINKKELERKRKGIKRTEDGKIIVDNCLKNALREISILKRIDCKNIIQLREIIHDDENNRIYLILELAENGPILEFDEKTDKFSINYNLTNTSIDNYYSEEQIKDFMRGIVNGIYYCKFMFN